MHYFVGMNMEDQPRILVFGDGLKVIELKNGELRRISPVVNSCLAWEPTSPFPDKNAYRRASAGRLRENKFKDKPSFKICKHLKAFP